MSHKSPPKKVHFVSLGCPKNLVDSEIMLGTLKQKNYQLAENPAEADAIVVNTCGFIEEAKEESISKIIEMSRHTQEDQKKKLVVAGCLTQRYQEDLVKGLPEVDLFVGSGHFQEIDKILQDSFEGSSEKKFFHLPTYLQEESTPRINSEKPHRAYLKISEGCKKRCAFCAIPLIRGNLQSRNLTSVLSEAKLLVASGVKELIVISHDFTDYGWDLKKQNFSAKESPYNLLKILADSSGAEWIRVLYLYPDGISPEVIELFKAKKNLVKYFDMPLQHINNTMLKRMNRRMTRQEIETVLLNLRTALPEAVLRTQFIVGFPGETEEQFQELLEFVAKWKFDRLGCFKYSIEENTKASEMPDQISESIKERRYHELMSLQQEISREKHRNFIGKTVDVLVEGQSEESEFLLQGRTSQQAPDIDGLVYINEGVASMGDMVKVEILDAHDYDLVGRIL